MERKRNSYPTDACEKIYKAFTVSPAFHTIRRISHRVQHTGSPSPASNSSASPPAPFGKAIDIQSKSGSSNHPKSSRNSEVAALVPINFDYSSLNEKPKSSTPPELVQKNTQIAKVPSKIEPETTPANTIADEVTKVNPKVKSEKGGKSGVHIEDRVTDYINRAKLMIRNMSRSSEGKNGTRKDKEKLSDNISEKDKFSDYIDRTRNKLQKASSIGAGKSNSFK
ncbi:hypothetical protein P3X46_015219 [Hevea brasiliensis]|uniref:DUF4005 domain-containing protein n=1 Tax=Hevea brasiliensis TaxID=3981 RepID=A0ABQ9LZ96_HEVBR|nr:hypothetical protein P3X46_015219 [Hevea brasiliensis]